MSWVSVCFHYVLCLEPGEKGEQGIVYLSGVHFLAFIINKQAASSSSLYSEYTLFREIAM